MHSSTYSLPHLPNLQAAYLEVPSLASRQHDQKIEFCGGEYRAIAFAIALHVHGVQTQSVL